MYNKRREIRITRKSTYLRTFPERSEFHVMCLRGTSLDSGASVSLGILDVLNIFSLKPPKNYAIFSYLLDSGFGPLGTSWAAASNSWLVVVLAVVLAVVVVVEESWRTRRVDSEDTSDITVKSRGRAKRGAIKINPRKRKRNGDFVIAMKFE